MSSSALSLSRCLFEGFDFVCCGGGCVELNELMVVPNEPPTLPRLPCTTATPLRPRWRSFRELAPALGVTRALQGKFRLAPRYQDLNETDSQENGQSVHGANVPKQHFHAPRFISVEDCHLISERDGSAFRRFSDADYGN